MRIHTDHNGVAVNAIHSLADGTPVEGHVYQILAGSLMQHIGFQNGPVREVGVNGITNEALLAILKHRLEFLNGQFPCAENVKALNHIVLAGEALAARTKDRMARGVEGINAA